MSGRLISTTHSDEVNLIQIHGAGGIGLDHFYVKSELTGLNVGTFITSNPYFWEGRSTV